MKMWTLPRKVISFLILTATVPCCLADFDVDTLTNCPEGDISFELTTGYVFTSPDSILDTRPGQNTQKITILLHILLVKHFSSPIILHRHDQTRTLQLTSEYRNLKSRPLIDERTLWFWYSDGSVFKGLVLQL
jgi:hypothetical protein